jgi:hypothetical protein
MRGWWVALDEGLTARLDNPFIRSIAGLTVYIVLNRSNTRLSMQQQLMLFYKVPNRTRYHRSQ